MKSAKPREKLAPHVGKLLKVRGKIKQFRSHPKRKELCSVLLRKIRVHPLDSESFYLDHIWVLKKSLKLAGIKEPKKNLVISFLGIAYCYNRGNTSNSDYSIYPLPKDEITEKIKTLR